MNFKRFITALILFPILTFLLFKASLSILLVLILFTAFICYYEWSNLFHFSFYWLFWGEVLLLMGLFLSAILNIPKFYIFYIFLFFSFLPFLFAYEKEKFKILFLPFLIGLIYLFIGLFPFWEILQEFKREYLVYFFSIIFANDTGAYLTGKAFGKHHFFPKISPKKTWEGFFGGICLAVIIAILLNKFWNLFPNFTNLFIAGFLAIVGTIGDLFESAFKRMVNKKDSGRIIWGHGGMLDRIDGVLFSAPLFLIFLNFLKK